MLYSDCNISDCSIIDDVRPNGQGLVEDSSGFQRHIDSRLKQPSFTYIYAKRQGRFRSTGIATSEFTFASAFGDALTKFAAFRDLPENWDSYGAEALSVEAYDSAIKLLQALQEKSYEDFPENLIPYFIAPTPDGGINIEWRSRNEQRRIEVEVSERGGFSVLQGTKIGDEIVYKDDGPVNLTDVCNLIIGTTAVS